MKDKERDIFDELLRSKLLDHEADTMPEDWLKISARLAGRKKSFPARWWYGAAAAVVSLLIIMVGIYLSGNDPAAPVLTEEVKPIERNEGIQPVEIQPVEPDENSRPLIAALMPEQPAKKAPGTVDVPGLSLAGDPLSVAQEAEETGIEEQQQEQEWIEDDSDEKIEEEPVVIPETETDLPETEKKQQAPRRKWSFGMGGGGLTAGSDNVVNTLTLRNTMIVDQDMLLYNAIAGQQNDVKTNIKHKTPISFGLSASRYLTDRFSLQTGLTYSMVTSYWEGDAAVHQETRQRLHFVGIPLSISYKAFEWKRFQVYAAAGIAAQMNVAGQLKISSFVNRNGDLLSVEYTSTRMKKLQWSTSVRAGISYPVIRFVSVFAEIGAAYYFENHSDIKTIYSEKPLNINPQVGIRLGF
ncbi:MAG: PorT family protein [Tannerellaceae bacterium]|jgi:hypothetical protein|nr:PorT family protein [Tannerellaceae bacterium]